LNTTPFNWEMARRNPPSFMAAASRFALRTLNPMVQLPCAASIPSPLPSTVARQLDYGWVAIGGGRIVPHVPDGIVVAGVA
jgi:hypothetical protein